MLIGKPGPAKTHICRAQADRIEVRGHDLAGDLMGRLSFTEYFHLLMTGREPNAEQRYFLDLLLVAIAEHGLTPTAMAARMTYDAAPDSLQAAVAAGILGCGTVVLGTAEVCGAVLVDARKRIDKGGDAKTVVETIAREIHARKEKMPGFGHPIHHPVDPRAERIMSLAEERGAAGRHMELARLFVPAVATLWRRRLPMNVSMAIAACLL